MSAAPVIDTYLSAGRELAAGAEGAIAEAVRGYVTAVRAFLGERHRDGAPGEVLNGLHSDLMDRLLRRLFALAEEGFFADGAGEQADLCVVAVGGYARREMSIHSDVDLLFLYRDKLSPHVAAVAERLQYWLWDAQLTVGGATRTIAETLALAKKDVSVCTAILAPRFLVGSGVLFHEFSQATRSSLLPSPERFVAAQLEAFHARHTQYGDSLYLLQPNIKEGSGGLRDYHAAYWVMQATQPSAGGREAFLHMGLLTEAETHEYGAALDFLWRVRNELHLISGRKNDQMSFEHQAEIAACFGYGEADSAEHELPVESFMRDYYQRARAVQNYSSLAIEQCLARVRRGSRRRRVSNVEDGFRIVNGQLEVPRARQLRERPLRLLSVFAVAQAHDVALTRKAQRLVRENLDLIDDAYCRDPQAVELFLRILDSDRRVMRSLMAMNEVGLLGRFLPEWQHIVFRWQQVMYHTYTVDVHSIFLVMELRRLWDGHYRSQVPALTELMRGVDDRPVLFLGCLLHDIGKGFGANHSEKGADRAVRCLTRMGLEPERSRRVVFLVRHHLLMSKLAQSRDLSDPKLILDFARTVGDRTNLRNLYLLTFADVRASSRTAWSDWKGQLLRELFERTSELLEVGSEDPSKAFELIERRVETRRDAARSELRAQGVSEADIAGYFEAMPRRYFTAHAPRQIARHAQVVLNLAPDQLMATAVRDMRGGFSEFILCARDRPGLYSQVAGVLTAHHINILGAYVYTSRSGIALEVYRLATPPGGEDERRIRWGDLERSLRSVLSGEVGVEELLRRRGRPVGVRMAPVKGPVSVEISNEESDFYTIVDVTANDRLGLLHDLTRTLAAHAREIYISKAATVLDQVRDTFYLKDRQGQKLLDPEENERLRQALLEAAKGDGDAGGR